jgi:hypothetical protein
MRREVMEDSEGESLQAQAVVQVEGQVMRACERRVTTGSAKQESGVDVATCESLKELA